MDYYQALDVARDATSDEIKKAYRKLALEHHPDRNQGSKEAEERFKEITQAYEVLSNSEKRARYDRFGAEGMRGNAGGGPAGFDFTDAVEVFMRDFGGFGGAFDDLFGQSRGRARASERKGKSLRVRLPLTLLEVAHGVTKRIRVALLDPCDACAGTGAADGKGLTTCPTCAGSGEERVVQRSVFGQFMSVSTCRSCGGEGQVAEATCPKCQGDSRTRSEQDIDVEVPPGVSSENFITLRGRGNVGPRGGQRGDIVVLLEVEEDARFIRQGSHLAMELPVTFAQVALGDRVEVEGLDATVAIDIPAGTQSGQVLRLKGHGVPDLETRKPGDLLVQIRVWTPERLSQEEEKALRALQEVSPPAPARIESSEGGGFWSRVKEAFRG